MKPIEAEEGHSQDDLIVSKELPEIGPKIRKIEISGKE